MPKVVALKEIRHDEQRFNLEDVCSFLLARNVDNLSDRMAKLARKHALETLKTVFERMPLQKFKAPGAIRATKLHYIQDPIELTNIVEELLRHYHSVSNKRGKSSKQFAKLWPQVIEFHRQFRVTWPHMWTDAYCATLSMSPLHEDAQQHYAKLAHMFSPSPSRLVGVA